MKDPAADWAGTNPAVGFWSAWITVALNFCYAAAAIAAGSAVGTPRDPYWAVAETLAIVGAVALVLLMAAIRARVALPGQRTLGTMALGWMLAFATLTITVHFVELTVARRIDFASSPELRRIFGFEWPSLIYAVEIVAWHICFALSLLCAAFTFEHKGRERTVRAGLIAAAALCLLGLSGPITGVIALRLIGVAGYGVLFPVVCVLICLVFKQSQRDRVPEELPAAVS